jgi:hypothetical protein
MKSMSILFWAALVLHAGAAAGDDVACRQTYSQAVRTCAHTLNLLSPDVRAGAQSACVEGARLTQGYCVSGISACPDDCLVAYDRSLAACEAGFDSAVCAGGVVCAQIIVQQRDNCLSYAVGVLDACTAACTPAR